ncbi:archaetidylserine synthase [Methanobrevibacter sp.]
MKEQKTNIDHFIGIPDIISLLNLSSGFLSIVFAINNNLKVSAFLIILAIIFDSSDGWTARKVGRNDEYGFGKNIDSLSDAISFGAAPAVLFYMIGKTYNGNLEIPIILISLLMVICGVLRLTRYNVIGDLIDYNGFIGFPIPGIGFILSVLYLSGLYNIYISMIIMIIVSLLMISNIKYPKFSNVKVLGFALIMIILMLVNWPVYNNISIPAVILLLITFYYLIRNIF